MQCACAVFSSVACPALRYFSALSHKLHDTWKNIFEYKICLIFSTTLSEIFLILRITERDMIKNAYCYSKFPLFLSNFNETSIFFRQSFEKYSNTKFHENPSSGSRVVTCGQTHRRMDVHVEAKSHFSPFFKRA